MSGLTKRMLFISVIGTVFFYVMVLFLKSVGAMPAHITWIKAIVGPGIAGLLLFSCCIVPILLHDYRSPLPRQDSAGSDHVNTDRITPTAVSESIPTMAKPSLWAFRATSAILICGLILIPVLPQIGLPLTLMNSLISSGTYTWAFICTRNRDYLRLMLLSLPFGLLAVVVIMWMLLDPQGFALLVLFLREHALIR